MSNIFEYKDPIIYNLRAGTSNDQFRPFTNYPYKVVDNVCLLEELPDPVNRVQIHDPATNQTYYEVEYDDVGQYEFKVNYTIGFVRFNPAANGKTLSVSYFGRGQALIPAARIWLKEVGGTVTENLQDIINNVIEFKYVGEYASNQQYKRYNIVSYQGAAYIAKRDATALPTHTGFWGRLSGFKMTGQYNAATSYLAGDIVSNEGNNSLYYSLISNNKGNPLSDSTKWMLLIDAQPAIDNANRAAEHADERAELAHQAAIRADEATERANAATANADLATEAANTATRNANTAADNANNKAEFAQTQGDYAKTQGDYAKEQGDYAKSKAEEAIEAKENADLATEDAIKATIDAIAATENANKAADSANMSADNADVATDHANTAADNAQNKADSFEYMGDYDPSKEYKVNNQVTYNGTTWICVQDSVGNEPGTASSYWRPFALGGEAKLMRYINTVTLSDSANTVNIAIPQFNQLSDLLLVYQNSVFIAEGADYTISQNNQSITRTEKWETGTIFNFVVLKNVPEIEVGEVDGAFILDNSITNNKLSTDIKIGSLGGLQTSNKDSVVSAINEINATLLDTANTLEAHRSATAAHSATAEATPNRIVRRDTNGQIKVGVPTEDEHVARLVDLNTVLAVAQSTKSDLDSHKSDTNVHGSTSDATSNRIPIRDTNGQFKVGVPTEDEHVARKVDITSAVDGVFLPLDGSKAMTGTLTVDKNDTHVILRAKDNTNQNITGIVYQNQDVRKWSMGVHPPSDQFRLYDYTKGQTAFDVIPNGDMWINRWLNISGSYGGMLKLRGNSTDQHAYMEFYNDGNNRSAWVGYGQKSDNMNFTINNAAGGDIRLQTAGTVTTSGHMRVGGNFIATKYDLPSFNGEVAFKKGNADAASFTQHNTIFKGWWGLGMQSYDDSINGVYDFRAGRWATRGGYRVNNGSRDVADIDENGAARFDGDVTARFLGVSRGVDLEANAVPGAKKGRMYANGANGLLYYHDLSGWQEVLHTGSNARTRVNNGQLEYYDGSTWKGAGISLIGSSNTVRYSYNAEKIYSSESGYYLFLKIPLNSVGELTISADIAVLSSISDSESYIRLNTSISGSADKTLSASSTSLDWRTPIGTRLYSIDGWGGGSGAQIGSASSQGGSVPYKNVSSVVRVTEPGILYVYIEARPWGDGSRVAHKNIQVKFDYI
ncbi:hypothetical protein [Paenibacillus sp. GCM10027626]|uniref:hypothetical protein n=1 Tax=Paenibacillus sp. GCM10027626 TaxID=3273411 RepID=UPI003629B50D